MSQKLTMCTYVPLSDATRRLSAERVVPSSLINGMDTTCKITASLAAEAPDMAAGIKRKYPFVNGGGRERIFPKILAGIASNLIFHVWP